MHWAQDVPAAAAWLFREGTEGGDQEKEADVLHTYHVRCLGLHYPAYFPLASKC